ncbi:BEL1-like homeodomain protein 1 isoform X1 [Gastrolobium bilobum]|uniref:BEL1-like homeodomain protein 1 isoform X1 n=1 Tax=Gastrolobium bilobum TaxID=150636 RepID=UPI002AAFD56B|nr:BEL1-like homeodomain protein 1 isoform X1 [Gastrolobium bilobum]XP_061372101.1 BEL1-like homeodomain protein 1 isoform X1 [Gastrolobium bilobum]
MASYFHGNTSDIQSSAEGLQTLYLMNPNYVPYSDAPQQPTPNMFLVSPNTTNSATTTPPNALNLINFSHAPPPPSPNNHHHHYQHQHLIGVTIPASNILGSTTTDDPARQSFLGQHEISGFHGFAAAATTAADATVAPRAHYNLWRSMIDQTASSAVTTSPSSNSGGVASAIAAADVSPRIGFHRPSYQQGLSLSLSSQQQTAYRSLSGDVDFQAISPASRGGGGGGGGDIHSFILGSKYLKALQELLDEVVNVGKGIYKGESLEGAKKEKMKANIESKSMIGEGSNGGVGENSGGNKQGTELTTALRQDLQMKKSKLVSMLDEVEQRYRQYHQQMQIVISSFEKVAGFGAAKSYVALALKTISKQFRCLKDAISSQIRTTSKTLGEDDCLGVKVEGSRLRYVDHHLRQQRTLQQLGMVQHNAWRPQRGLPERAVSILRAWLFEHFLHPYPKDSDKVMLAKQTGLTRSQVSNWFINARVRLWKPMVEEMYLEETKEQEQNNGSQDNKNKSKESSKELWSAANVAQESGAIMRPDQFSILQSKAESFNNLNTSPTEISNSNSLSTSPIGGGSLQSQSFFHLAGSSDMQRSPKKPRSSEMQNSPGSILSVDMEMKSETNRERHKKDGYPLMTGNENHVGGYGAFSLEEDIGRFNVTEHLAPRFHGNGVSLTLGLPHSENLTLSGNQHGFLSQNIHLGTNENEFCAINTPPSSHSGTSYESIDIQNRKRFSAQLLRDFVA